MPFLKIEDVRRKVQASNCDTTAHPVSWVLFKLIKANERLKMHDKKKKK